MPEQVLTPPLTAYVSNGCAPRSSVPDLQKDGTEAPTHLCLALAMATQLALAVQNSGEAIEGACDALVRALRQTTTDCSCQRMIHGAGASDRRQSPIRSYDGTSRRPPARMMEGALSARERDILELIGCGLSNKEIARSLGIGPETVKSHVSHIFIKLGVEKRAQAVSHAQTLGWIKAHVSVPNTFRL